MTIGVSLFIIALGAILRWGVSVAVEGANLEVIGLILIIVGVAGLVLGLVTSGRFGRTTTRERIERDAAGEERITERRHL